MKQCPFCKAEIEDNARFCLYCMTPLNQKEVITPQKQYALRRPLTVVGVLLIALAALLLLPDKKPTQPQEPSAPTTLPTMVTTAAPTGATAEPTAAPTWASTGETAATEEATAPSATENIADSTGAAAESTGTLTTRPRPTVAVPNSRPTTAPTYKPATGSTTAPTYKPATGSTAMPTYKPNTGSTSAPTYKPATGSTSAPTYKPTTGSTSAPTYKPATGSTSAPTYKPATGSTTAPTYKPATGSTSAPTYTPTTVPTTAPTTVPTTAPTTAPTATPTVPAETVAGGSVVYSYYQASNRSYVWGTTSENDVYITGITAPVGTKEIVIPAYIDGKRVVGLDFPSFYNYSQINNSVTSVYLPKTLLCLTPDAFQNTNIQNLYIAGESIYINGDSDVDRMQIHCSQTCKNISGGKLFSSSARWVEWNGAMPEPADFIALPNYYWNNPDDEFIYHYRQAVQSDVLGLDYQVTENDIVITKIVDYFNDYPLFLPDYIDGKRVIALGSWVFKEPDGAIAVEKIYLPETLLAIHRDTLTGTDITTLCIESETLAIEDKSALEDVKIMCSKTCVDQYGDKYSDRSNWREWNG